MLNKINIVEEMKTHFSKWMDIRKRVNTSNGGALLHSISEEIEDINIAIKEYKEDFFIKTYLNQTDKIISFLYKGFLGDIDHNEIKIEGFKRAYNKKDFYSTRKTFFIENNYLYIKEEVDEIQYLYKGYPLNLKLEYHHVWNVYDEFATFLGLTRYDKENNEFLLNRILAESIYRPNSHKQGIKNAIKNAVINYDDLKDEEISIENISPENIKKYQKHFDDILEELTFINKDVLRAKRWDVDVWEYGFDNIDYIPHLWDVVLEHYVDGTGFNNSLKIGINNKPTHSNVRFSFYEKSEQMIEEYIKNKNINYNIPMELIQYKNQLKMDEAEYKIDAHSILDITNQNIFIESYKATEREFSENVTDLLDEVLPESITSSINTNLETGDKYKLRFKARSSNTPMNIKAVYKVQNNKKIDMMDKIKMKHPFINKDGEIINTRCYIYANKKNQFSSLKNIKFKNEKMEMENILNKSTLSLDIDGANNKFVKANYTIKPSIVSYENIKMDGFIQEASNVYSVNKKYGELEIDITANFLSLEIKGKAEIVINDKEVLNIVNDEYQKIVLKEEDVKNEKLKIKIKDFSNNTSIRLPYYKNYNIKYAVQNGAITNINNNLILPDENNNHLIVEFETFTGHPFIIDGIYIGNDTIHDELDLIDIWDENIENLVIETNCRIELYRNDNIVDRDFIPTIKLTSNDDNQFIKLNLDKYKNIVMYDKDVIKREYNYYLVLNKGESKDKIKFYATKQEDYTKEYINELFNISNGDKLYISNSTSSFLIKRKNEKLESKRLDKKMLKQGQDIYIIKNINKETIEPVFYIDYLGNKILDEKISQNFLYISLDLVNSNHHIAINKYKMYNTIEENVDIINNFQDPLDEGIIMFYRISSLSNNFKVLFMNGLDWSIGKEKIRIESKDEINKPDNYETEISFVNKDFILSKEIHLDRYLNGHDLTNSIIKIPSGHSVHYESKYVNDDIITAPEFFREEVITSNLNKIVKLKSTNIDEIIHMSFNPWGQNKDVLEKIDYQLLSKEGIIIFNEIIDKPLFIVYTINIPTKIIISDDILYSKVSIPITAYKKIEEHTRMLDLQEEVSINIKELYSKEYDKIDVTIENPSFTWTNEGDTIKIFAKDIEQNSISVNPGYYYQDGKEYYTYHTPVFIDKENHNYVTKENVTQKEGYLIFNKEAYNFIKNTSFVLNDEDTIFFADYENNYDKIIGISTERITACDNYNYWNRVNMDIKLVKGLNGDGIYITPRNNMLNYIYIDITKYISDNNYITLFANQGVNAFLGIGLDKKSNIENYANKIYDFKRAGDFLSINLNSVKEVRENKIYLIINGQGMFDDILISKEEKFENHYKNLNLLNIPELIEKKSREFEIDNIFDLGAHYQTELNGNSLSIASTINWREKEIKAYKNKEDWLKCIFSNVDLIDNKVITKDKNGEIITEPILIKNNKNIEEVIITINEMNQDNTDYEITIMTGNNMRNVNENIARSNQSIIKIDNNKIKKYIAVKIKISSHSFINQVNIYSTYKEDFVAKPESVKYNRGKFISKVFDLSKESTYIISEININDIKEKSYISTYVRAARLNDRNEYIWSDWKDVKEKPEFRDYKLFQFQIDLKDKEASIDIKSIKIEERG